MRGFTLIEVSIVLFIMLLMTSATVPWMKTFAETTKLKSASRGIRDLLEFARASAITGRTEYAVLFDIDNGQYLLTPKSILDEISDGTTTGTLTNFSLTEISQDLANLSLEESEEEKTNNTDSYASRTSGVLGVINKVPETIEIAEIISPRNTNGNSSTDYVVFYPDSSSEDFELYLQGVSGKVFIVSVAESTGRAGIRQMTDEEAEQMGLTTDQSKKNND